MATRTYPINTLAYLIDNSYSQDLTTGESPTINNGAGLAGRNGTKAVQVKILTDPFKIKLPSIVGRLEVLEMVIVEYKQQRFLVLNCFGDDNDDSFTFEIDYDI